MTGIVDKIKDKVSSDKSTEHTEQPSSDEPTYSIQPHPAKSNNPADVEGPQLGGGLNSNPEWQAYNAKGPYQPSKEISDNLPEPAGRDELRARSAELNQ